MVGIDSSSPRLLCPRETTAIFRLLPRVCAYTFGELSEAFCVLGLTKRVVSGSNSINDALIRCSKAHVCNVVSGNVKNTPRLPAVRMGRRILIRRETLELWKQASEQGTEIDAMISPSGKSAVDA
jgi:hypothetical protein